MKKILIIDDEYEMIQSLRKILSLRDQFDLHSLDDGTIALEEVKKNKYDLIICDLKIGKVSGLDVVRNAVTAFPESIVIMISGYGTVEASVDAVKAGAFDFIEKPFTSQKLFDAIDRALKTSQDRPELEYHTIEEGQIKLVYKSNEFNRLVKDVRKIAGNSMNVLITGESGTGKELIARAIHSFSDRKQEPFVPVNCGALPENLFESELFGHEKGAFTGAVKNKPGLLEFANQGTFFLDEVGELTKSLQVKLLRMLEERKIRRVGGQKEISIDVRIIAATNKDLESEIEKDLFRKDLFYRLNTLRVHIPPLRERTDDIIPLADYFLDDLCQGNKKNKKAFSDEAIDALITYSWQGNVRELQNVIGRAYFLSSSNVINIDDLPLPNKKKSNNFNDGLMDLPYKLAKDKILESFEQEYLTYNLKKHEGNISHTAQECGIDRRSIHRLISKHNIIYKE